MENKEYIALFERFIRSQVSEQEKEMLKAWFGKDTSREVIYAYYMEQWNGASDQLSAEIQYRMLENIKSKIKEAEQENSADEVYTTRTSLLMTKFVRVAVAACVIGLVSFSTYYFTRSNLLRDTKEFAVSVGRGQKASVALPDGTTVWLNSDSKLSYSNAYNVDLRRVNLQGEAFFQVAKNKQKRFIVSTKGIDVEALGTAFSVRSYVDDSLTTTTLAEGKVSVGNEKFKAILLPNEAIIYNSVKGTFGQKHTVNADYIAQWRNDRITFNGESLGEIATSLERMYNVDILFGSSKVRNYRFTGVIRNNSLSNVFEIISLTAPIKYKITNNTVEIQEKN